MEDDEKVVSLAHHRAKRGEARTAGKPSPGTAAADGTEPTPPPAEEDRPGPLPGRLIWLHCPTCGSMEYTEAEQAGGRRHKCGTIVREAPVEIDVRGEFSVAEINLQRIDAIAHYLGEQRERFTEYQRRLELMAGHALAPYPLDEEGLGELPVAEVDALGLLISPALHEPAARFAEDEET